MSTIEALRSELELSKNVVRVLMKDLTQAEKEIQDLRAITLTTSASEGVASRASSSRQRRASTRTEDDLAPNDVKSGSDVSADVIIEQLQSQCDQLLRERAGLQELANQSQSNADRLKKYKAKNKALKEKMGMMKVEYSETKSRLETERDAAIMSYVQFAERVQEQTQFDPVAFMEDRNNINTYQGEKKVLTVSTGVCAPNLQAFQHLLKVPKSPPFIVRDDGGLWCHPSGSHLLILEPTVTYHPDAVNSEDRFERCIPKKEGFRNDLFYFHTRTRILKYYGLHLCVGAKAVTLQQAEEELLIPEQTLDFLKRKSIHHPAGSSRNEHEWVHQMYMKGIFKIMCIGYQLIGFNAKLLTALNRNTRDLNNPPVRIPIPGQDPRYGGPSKRKNPPTSEGTHERCVKRKKN
ncbi:hypothetical protein QCA50_009165 [Cerrena zonata]|uniref:Uncharacterized protein n=1 Tax=Cerrena zonata TaxID=2478898 RepID=A0AAW0GED9_9APHY